ncbi:MAG: TetR family transcriptional regulator [Marmoricola sp.]|nr:TetR family transcriptional regulator [Marmoricola sp.]
MATRAKTEKRSYDSPRRRATAVDTRRAVIDAASRLFTERGWSTSVRDIAREAGVAVETVYSVVGSKRELMKVAIDVGVVGDDEPVPLAERAEFAALGEGDRRTRLDAVAAIVSDQYTRVAELHQALDHAAVSDPELAELQRHIHDQQVASYADALAMVLGRRPDPELVDGLQAVSSPAVFLHLVQRAGWSTDHYREWLAQTLLQLVVHIPEESA